MASNNTTFTPITTGTRDSSSDKGAIYYLNGNATDGRLNISDGAKWIAGDDTTVVYDGNTSHSYMLGTIQANDFKIVAVPNTNGRIDFGGITAGWDVENISFVFLGNGSVYNHLEDNSSRSNFRGNTKFKIDMDSGEAYLQFSSKEYRDISLDVKSSNNATLNIFPARSTDGFTSFTGFKTIGVSSMTLKKGLTATAHGRIYDPTYEGATNNLISLQTDSPLDVNRAIEYFSIDVSTIADGNTKAYVKDSNGLVLFNDTLDSADLNPKANDGTTLLDFYDGRKVILCEVRKINHILNSTRNQIEYIIRKNGYNEIKQPLFSMNNPISINEMTLDSNYSNNTGLTEISSSEEFYDMYKNLLTTEITTANAISVTGSTLVIAAGWSIVRDQTLTQPIEIVGAEIRVKTGTNGLLQTSKFDSFIGDVDASFDGHTDMLYLNSSGNTTVRFNNVNPEGFTLNATYPANVLVRKVGTTPWTNINTVADSFVEYNPLPNEDWEYTARVPGYEWTTITAFNTGDYGLSVNLSLVPFRDLNGNTIFNQVVDESIVSSFTFDFVDNLVLQTNTTNALMKIPFTEAFVGMQRIEHDPVLVTQLTDKMIPNAERNGFILDNNSTITFKASDASNANVQLLFNIVSIVNGERVLQIDRFTASANGYYILMSSEVVNFSAPFPTVEANAAAVRTELSTELARIDENVSKEKLVDIKKVNGVAVATISDFKTNENSIADAILDVPYGFKTDGTTPVGFGTLGEHWWQFYPPEIIRQMLEMPLNGITIPTRFNPIPGNYEDGTLGDALREILNRSTQTSVTAIKTKVDNLPDDTETSLSTIDTEVSNVKSVVDDIDLRMKNMPIG